MKTPGAIGVIGIGNMGLALALRLIDARHRIVVRDLRPEVEAVAGGAGARIAPNPAALAREVDLVIVVVVDAAQCDAVLFGEQGAADVLRSGCTVMLCPTISPVDVERIASRLHERRLECIDAPMSGGPLRARDGTMSLMVACDDAVFARHEAVLRVLSSRLMRVGQRLGDGARTKLVNNLLAAVNLAGAAEAIALAERLGLDALQTLEVIEQSSGQSWIGSDRMRRALAGDLTPRAHTRLLAKDSTLALDVARAVGMEPALGGQAQRLFQLACESGLVEMDDASLLMLLRRSCAVPLGPTESAV